MITVSRLPAAAIAALALLLPAPALRAGTVVSTYTGVGLMVGLAREIVYDSEVQPRYLLSELDWPMRPLSFASTGLSVEASFGLAASLVVSSGIPAKTGTMTDRDFMNYDGELTHFSSHTSFAEHALLADARLGWLFALGGILTLKPFLALSVMRLAWSARDGYLQYPPESAPPFTPWSTSVPRSSVHGLGIRYEQNTWFPAVGVAATFHPFPALEASVSMTGSPFVLCTDVDNHFLRSVEFHETFAGGFALEPSLAAAWSLGDRARLSLGLSYRYVGGLVGDAYQVLSGVEGYDAGAGDRSPTYRDGAGVALSYLRASLGLTLSL